MRTSPEPGRPRGVPPDVALGAASRSASPTCGEIQNYHTARVREVREGACTRSREGNGTVLDHSIILFGSNMANSDAHNTDPLPQALIGPRRRPQGQPAPALPAGHAARQHPGHDAAPRGRSGPGHREVRRQHRPDLGGVTHAGPLRPRRRRCAATVAVAMTSAAVEAQDAAGGAGRGRERRRRRAEARRSPKRHCCARARRAGKTSTAAAPTAARRCSGPSTKATSPRSSACCVPARRSRWPTPTARRRWASAAEVGNAELIGPLLEAGADPDSPNPDGQTALQAVARTGNVAAARPLLKAGAAVDAREGWGGQTALMWASARRHPEMMRLLLAKGPT